MSKKQSSQKITALYARLSRDDENEDVSGSIKNQRAILEKYAKDNRLPNPRFFFDDGYSGVTFARPAFTEILELAEQGMIENLVVKDHSRLGRNRLVVGQLLEEEFERLGIRYFAIMDNIDTAKGLSDLVPMQDLFNEWHAKNTSEKVRRVMQSKGMAGIPLTTNPPFGYMKNPDNKKEWIVDEPAAEVVRRIFDMCISGLGPAQIAKRLKAEGVMTPTEYWSSIKRKCGYQPSLLHNWNSDTVARILLKQEYCGDTVNFRTGRKSFKIKKKIERPEEEWKIFSDTHPAIISREKFELVQSLRKHKRRNPKTGFTSMFSGLLYCEDCGNKLYYGATNNYKREQAFFFCSAFRRDTSSCTAHYIREKVIYNLVLENMQRVLWYVQCFEEDFAAKQIEELDLNHQKDLKLKHKELEKAKKRIAEIDRIIQTLYEDNTRGKISDERFATLSESLEDEQRELKDKVPDIETFLEETEIKCEGLQHFIERAKRITRLTELTPEIIHEFIEKIVVSAPEKIDGKRHQTVDIYYHGAGIIKMLSAEEMEEAYQQHISKQHKAKTA